MAHKPDKGQGLIRLHVSARTAKRQVDAPLPQQGVLSLGQWRHAVKGQTRGSTPNHHVAVAQPVTLNKSNDTPQQTRALIVLGFAFPLSILR